MPTRRRVFACLLGLALLAGAALPGGPARAAEDGPVVFAAASLKTALDAINAAYAKETGTGARIAYAASSALAKQIENGAPASLFISADLAWMNELQTRGLIDARSRVTLLGNAIVLVGPKDGGATATIAPGFPLAALLGDGRLAMGAVDSVPAGKYGKAALQSLGVWDSVKDRLAEAENVRAALLLVSRGEAPLGIVYRTDVAADPSLAVVGTFPETSHPAIVYPAALTATAEGSQAAAFLDYLKGPAAKAVFAAQGFDVLPPSSQ